MKKAKLIQVLRLRMQRANRLMEKTHKQLCVLEDGNRTVLAHGNVRTLMDMEDHKVIQNMFQNAQALFVDSKNKLEALAGQQDVKWERIMWERRKRDLSAHSFEWRE